MQTITLMTGNPKKLKEWQRQLPNGMDLQHYDVNVTEIQGTPTEIVQHKLQQAYGIVQGPVIVEDVSMAIDTLNGMPGPYVKHFIEALGRNALFTLTGHTESSAQASCTAGYFDGEQQIIVTGTVAGRIVEPRGEGFGFDPSFQPDGSLLTFAEMGPEQKDTISHRHLAITKLLAELERL